MLILVTNDDGINASALYPLKQALDDVANTVVFAPNRNWSASGHPKTINRILRVDPTTLPDGSPAFVSSAPPPDCVAMALLGLVEPRPNLVVSGINHGPNLGHDLFYSGTVAAAVEAVIDGLPALALSRTITKWHNETLVAETISADNTEAYDHGPASTFAANLATLVLENGLPANTFLNVNIPDVPWAEVKGIAVTCLGRRIYRDELIRSEDPRGRPYYWIGGQPPSGVAEHGTDIWAVEHGLISVTPVNLDMTSYQLVDDFKSWQLEALM